jgi:hypothetical protein
MFPDLYGFFPWRGGKSKTIIVSMFLCPSVLDPRRQGE